MRSSFGSENRIIEGGMTGQSNANISFAMRLMSAVEQAWRLTFRNVGISEF